jgi:hypothetical protein
MQQSGTTTITGAPGSAGEYGQFTGSIHGAGRNAVNYTVPMPANGKVYVGTRGNNTGGAFGSTHVSCALYVYGLKPN